MPNKSIEKKNPKVAFVAPKDTTTDYNQPSADLGYGNSIIGSALSAVEEQSSLFDGALLNLTSDITGIVSPVHVSNQDTQSSLDIGFMRDSQAASGQQISLERLQYLMAQSSGSPLPMVVAQRMEEALGHEFHNVRVHTDSAAAKAAQGISAYAFTSGRDIYFNQGMFQPGSRRGDALIGHELTHVIQHDEGRINTTGVSEPSDSLEREAEKQGNLVAQFLHTPAAKVEDANEKNIPSSKMDSLTRSLVQDLIRALDLPAQDISIRSDETAKNRTEQVGSTGLMENGEVFIHPEAFRPDTTSGKELLAHEMAHIAQENLSPATEGPAGLLAEAEASQFAQEFVSGASISPLQYGIPSGHVAADPGDSTFLQKVLVQADNTRTKDLSSTLPTPMDGTGEGGTQNRKKKVRQYKEGVDGIADQIEDLQAFDDLCDAVSDNKSTSGPLNRIRGSQPYKRLCQMWQGAKDGEEDASQMKQAFNREFDDRGFWGSTEKAFDLVEAAAKRDARPAQEMDQVKQDQNKGEEAATELEDLQNEGGNGDQLGGEKGTVELPEGVSQELMNQPVEPKALEIDSYNLMTSFPQTSLHEIHEQLNHRQGLAEGFGGSTFDDRTVEVLGTVASSFGESFADGFGDTLMDTLVFDTAGAVLDKGLSVATKGRFNVPFVGPVITILQTKPWEAESTKEYLMSAFGGNDIFSDNSAALFSTETWTSGWEHAQDAGDYIGIFCDKVADLLTGIGDVISGLQTMVGSLSALAYIAGGCLLGIGLALVWLAGVGAPLIAAGGWCTNAGMILSRIATALAGISVGISLLATVFRTAAALMVPTEMYAEQLQGASEASSKFGTQAGNKIADQTCDTIKGEVQARYESHKRSSESGEGGGAPKGQDAAKKIDQDIHKEQDTVVDVSKKLEDSKKQKKEESKKSKDQDPIGTKKRLAVLGNVIVSRMRPIKNIADGINDLKSASKDAWGLVRNPKKSALQGVPESTLRDLEDRRKVQEEKLKSEIDSLRAELKKNPPSPEQRKMLTEELQKIQNSLSKNQDQKIRNEGEIQVRETDTSDASDKLNEAQEEKKRLKDDEASKKEDLEEATKERMEAEQEDARIRSEHDEAKKQQEEASKQMSAKRKAEKSNKEADKIEATKKSVEVEIETLRNKSKALDEVDQIDQQIKSLSKGKSDQEAIAALQTKRESLVQKHDISENSIAKQQSSVRRKTKKKEKQQRSLEERLQAKRNAGQYDGPSTEELINKRDGAKNKKQELRSQFDPKKDPAKGLKDKEASIKAEVEEIKTKQERNDSTIKSEQERVNTEARKPPESGFASSSGRMMGGTGSAWSKELPEAIGSFISFLNGEVVQGQTQEEKKADQEKEKKEIQARFEAMTEKQRQAEVLLDILPPVSFMELTSAQEKAAAAYERYSGFHADAYKAFVAEQAITGLSAETEALAKSGDPVQKELKRQEKPIGDAKNKTKERDTVLDQGNTEIGDNKEDTGIISMLIEKLSSNADNFSNQPSVGGDDSENINKGVQEGKDQSKQQKEEAAQESAQQRAVLDEALSIRALQQQNVDENISALESKHQHEQGILQEVRAEKAQRLAARNAAREEVETHTQVFNVGVQQIQSWSSEYTSKKADI